MSRPWSAYWELDDLKTSAFPTSVLDLIGEGMGTMSLALFLVLLRKASETKRTVVRMHTHDLLKALNVTAKTLKLARDQLGKFGLIVSTEAAQRGYWDFELRNPINSGPLPSRANVDFATLTDTVVTQFYQQQLPGRWDSKRGAFWCPFASHMKPQFRVVLDHGTTRHGMWNCQDCANVSNRGHRKGDTGGLIKFFQRLHGSTYQEATRQTRNILQGLVWKETYSPMETRFMAATDDEPEPGESPAFVPPITNRIRGSKVEYMPPQSHAEIDLTMGVI